MCSVSLDDLAASLKDTSVSLSGVSFKGKALKLNDEKDAKMVVEAIENCKKLEYLNLEGNTLGVEAAKVIGTALETHPEFKRALWKDMFTGRMKTEIPKALQYLGASLLTANARLVELDMSDNAFGPIGVEGLASLLRSSSCYCLEELRLNNNGLGKIGGKLLSEALIDCYNSSKKEGKPLALKIFVAGRNRLENEGATALANVFKTIGTLEEIIMPQNGIYYPGITALSDAFVHNKNLALLNLNDNTMGLKGVEAFVKALPTLQNIKSINFGDCLLKNKGAILLADGLKCGHVKLEELLLGSNEIKKTGGLALADAMENKINLKNLMLDGNQFGESGKTELESKMKKIGKINTLASLEENESEDSDEDDDHHEEISIDEEENENENPIEDSLNTFLNNPTAVNFKNLGENRVEIILEYFKQSKEDILHNLIKIIMIIGSLNKNNDEEISKDIFESSEKLYKKLFQLANEKDSLSIVNNSLLVHLGLLKCEDKKFKPTWNVENSMSVLEKLSKTDVLPESTKSVLKAFLGRSTNGNPQIDKTKKSLLSSLK